MKKAVLCEPGLSQSEMQNVKLQIRSAFEQLYNGQQGKRMFFEGQEVKPKPCLIQAPPGVARSIAIAQNALLITLSR
jgi:hypothetical protein